jgi:Mrp family chromosome partitioning ATPase
MSAIDQAFIRAYQPDDAPAGDVSAATQYSAIPAPHVGVHPQFRMEPAPSSARPPARAIAEEAPAGRRPLSTFAKPGPIVEARFKPALEVDRFRWSAICDDLVYRHPENLRPVLQTLLAADDAGRSLIGVGSPSSGTGCTTVLACLARLIVQAGKSVAIVDGNFAAPGLAAQLGLAVETGWEEVLCGASPLAESVVYSLTDRVALLPLVAGGATAAENLESIQASVTAGVLRYHYDLVLFDLGALADPRQGPTVRRLVRQCRLDGVVLTSGHGPAAVKPQRLMQAAPELAALCLGVVENQARAA